MQRSTSWALVGLTLFIGARALVAQATSDPMQQLLTEIRGLRADIQRSIRAHGMAVQLSVQEQRVAGLRRELAQAQDQRMQLRQAHTMVNLQMNQIPPEQREAARKADRETYDLRMRSMEDREKDLRFKLQEAEVLWTQFNSELGALLAN